MTKAEKLAAERKATEMVAWSKTQWAAFNRTFAAQETVTSLHAIDREAYKAYMINAGIGVTESAGGHYAVVTKKTGQSYVDYAGMLTELAEMGVDTDALIRKYTKRRANTKAFSFK